MCHITNIYSDVRDEDLMSLLNEFFEVAAKDKRNVIIWFKGGEKIAGRVHSVENNLVLLTLSGEAAEFQNYTVAVLVEEVAALAWVVP